MWAFHILSDHFVFLTPAQPPCTVFGPCERNADPDGGMHGELLHTAGLDSGFTPTQNSSGARSDAGLPPSRLCMETHSCFCFSGLGVNTNSRTSRQFSKAISCALTETSSPLQASVTQARGLTHQQIGHDSPVECCSCRPSGSDVKKIPGCRETASLLLRLSLPYVWLLFKQSKVWNDSVNERCHLLWNVRIYELQPMQPQALPQPVHPA